MAASERGRFSASLSPRRALFIAAIFLTGYLGVAIVGNALNRYELTRTQERLDREIQALEAQQRRLEALRLYMQTDEFIERAAREEGLVRPGDIAVAVAAPTTATTPVTSTGPWWERYFATDGR